MQKVNNGNAAESEGLFASMHINNNNNKNYLGCISICYSKLS